MKTKLLLEYLLSSSEKKLRRAFADVSLRGSEIVNQLFVPDWVSERHEAAYTER